MDVKKYVIAVVMLLSFFVSSIGLAAEISSDKMGLDWSTSKVWMVGDELCAQGTFVNKRADWRITEINDFTMQFVFTKEDGTKYVHVAKPKSLPLCKIAPNGSKKLTLNFGKFDGIWKKWVTRQDYTYSYQEGMRW